MPGTRKLGRATDSRNAMLRAMVTYLFENPRQGSSFHGREDGHPR